MASRALTVIKILKGAPCDNTYSDVIKFGSAGAQTGYFSGLAKYSFTNCSYQRVNNSVAYPRGALSCRIPVVADSVYDCNYVMFQNTFWGNKWFYAFIKQVNYISPETTEIIYEIDSYQTYQFDYTVKPSMVVREHPEEDTLFANSQPEPITITHTDINGEERFNYGDGNDNGTVWVLSTPSGKEVNGYYRDHIYTTASPIVGRIAYELKQQIQNYFTYDNENKIIAVQSLPFACADPSIVTGGAEPYEMKEGVVFCSLPEDISGYTPKYKKCFSFPFCYLKVTDRCSNNVTYAYEKFGKWTYSEGKATYSVTAPSFVWRIKYTYPVAIQFVPYGYDAEENEENWDNGFIISDFPSTSVAGNGAIEALKRTLDYALKVGVNIVGGKF